MHKAGAVAGFGVFCWNSVFYQYWDGYKRIIVDVAVQRSNTI